MWTLDDDDLVYDEYEGINSVTIKAAFNRVADDMGHDNIRRMDSGKRVVNGVWASNIYEGMSTHRLEQLQNLYNDAYDNVLASAINTGSMELINSDYKEFDILVDAEFRRLCKRAAEKAAWNRVRSTNVRGKATKPKASKNHPSKKKVTR